MQEMRRLPGLLLAIIFAGLSLIHFYWALGGSWGLAGVLPTNEQGSRVLAPGAIGSAVVGAGLLLFSLFYLLGNSPKTKLPPLAKTIAAWVIPLIFVLRAIGDFQYVGFFKQITGTQFAQLDTLYFSPLCLFIGLTGILHARLK